MSHRCPRCNGTHFIAARIEGAETLALVLQNGGRCALKAHVCDDCGLVEFVAPHEPGRSLVKPDDGVQQADF